MTTLQKFDLQIQCYAYKNSQVIFHGLWKTIQKLAWKQKTPLVGKTIQILEAL